MTTLLLLPRERGTPAGTRVGLRRGRKQERRIPSARFPRARTMSSHARIRTKALLGEFYFVPVLSHPSTGKPA